MESNLPKLCAKLMRPYVKAKIMGPLYYSTVQRCIDQGTIIYQEDAEGLLSFLLWKRYKKSPGILLDKMAVREGLTGKSIGSEMLNRLKEIAQEEKRYIKLRVAKTNEPGIRFYEQNGFMNDPYEEKEIVYTMTWDPDYE